MKIKFVPLLSSFSAALMSLSTLPANALMLEGNVRQDNVPQAAPQQQAEAPRAPMAGQVNAYNGPAAAPQAHMMPQTASANLTAAATITAKREARANAMQGIWQCVTQVTGSTTPGVSPGQVVRCEVQYTRDANGNLLENWTENGWTPSTAAVVKLDSDVITVSHVSSYPSRGGTISARSTDAIKLVAPDTILAQGMVNQYSNGKFIGQYRTSSVLRKAG